MYDTSRARRTDDSGQRVALLESQDELAASHEAYHTKTDAAHRKLHVENEDLRSQLEWLKPQVFGSKSERRVPLPEEQLTLGQMNAETPASIPTLPVRSHQRQRAQTPVATGESGVRFDPSVPVKVIEVPNPELDGLPPESYTTIREVVTERLVQKPSSFEVNHPAFPEPRLPDSDGACSDPSTQQSIPSPSIMTCPHWLYHLPCWSDQPGDRRDGLGGHTGR